MDASARSLEARNKIMVTRQSPQQPTTGDEFNSFEPQDLSTVAAAVEMDVQATQRSPGMLQKKATMICVKRRGIFSHTWKARAQAHYRKRQETAAAFVRREGLSAEYKDSLKLAPEVEFRVRMRLGATRATQRFLKSIKEPQTQDAVKSKLKKQIDLSDVNDLVTRMAAAEIDGATFRRVHVDELTAKMEATSFEGAVDDRRDDHSDHDASHDDHEA